MIDNHPIPKDIRKKVMRRILARQKPGYLPMNYYDDNKQYAFWFHFSGRDLGKTWVLANNTVLKWLRDGSEFLYLTRDLGEAYRVTKDGFWGKEMAGTGCRIHVKKATGEIFLALDPEEYNFGNEVTTKVKDLETGETDVIVTFKEKLIKIGIIKGVEDLRSSGDWSRTNRVIFEEVLHETYRGYLKNETMRIESILETIRPLPEYGNVQLIGLGNLTTFHNPYFAAHNVKPSDCQMGKRLRLGKDRSKYNRHNILFDFRTCEGYVDRMLAKYGAKDASELTPYEHYAIYGELLKVNKDLVVNKRKGQYCGAINCVGWHNVALTIYKDKGNKTVYLCRELIPESTPPQNMYNIDLNSESSRRYAGGQVIPWLRKTRAANNMRFVGYEAAAMFEEVVKGG